jgi:hypothetical protein
MVCTATPDSSAICCTEVLAKPRSANSRRAVRRISRRVSAAATSRLFAIVNITEIVLTAKARPLAASPAVVQALWAVHAAAFGLDLAAIAVALLGLSHAAASMRLIPGWLTVAAWPGAACLLIASVFTVALANGGPWGAVGLAGFIIWLVFVITASVSLLRDRPNP